MTLRRRPTVLMYHGFSDGPRHDDPYHLSVPVQHLQAQLDHLRAARWEALDLDAYLACWERGRAGRSYLVTIDDALQTVADLGAPVLAAAGVPSVLFTPPALLGGVTWWLDEQPEEPVMSADTLRAVQGQGVEVGVHGWDHLTLLGMSDAELLRHTVEAREAVADVTGVLPRAFAYPFGDHDARAREAVARAGYEVAFAVYDDAGAHAVSRSDVKPADSVTAFRVKLIPRYRLVWRAAGSVKPVRRLLRRSAQAA